MGCVCFPEQVDSRVGKNRGYGPVRSLSLEPRFAVTGFMDRH
jgi:hypothetical protein